jgi:class 3 adenylate cyclase/tetratricopeptide (TPR) repeat protein
MHCSRCDSDNREGRKFCANCGAPLSVSCPKCGASNRPGEKFCGECGAGLADATVAKPPEAKTVAATSGERRHLTVLFCDLVGSTEIAAKLDPEEWRELVASYHRAASEAVTRNGGHIAKYLGDGIMAYFGYPEAHENDAERATRAGLAIVEGLSKLNQESTNPKVSVRVGIDSGTVVVGAGAGKEIDVFGEAPNNAAHLQALAAPSTVLISAATHRLVSGLFVVEARGAQALKASEHPIQIYRVIQPSGVRGRLEAAAATRGLTPFVGREEELRLLMNRWERALDDEGQVALIVGEAGIGKSRLLQHFHQQILATPHTWVEAAAAPSFQNTPFYPIAELLRLFTRPREGQADEERLTQLETQLTAAGLKPAEALPLIAPLLNLSIPAKYAPLPYSPEQQRRRFLAIMVNLVLGAARVQSLIIATEDLHWADPSTLELIQLLVEQGATARLLLLYTARPEFRAQWPLRAHHTQITLNRLSVRGSRAMIEQVAARQALSDETVAAVVERTGGVPLFVEELTRAVLETGNEKLTGREIPVTLRDSLMARLDRLGPAKEVAQVGAVIGGEFSYELIRAVYPVAEDDLHGALRTLADADLIYVRGIAPEAMYQFKHALIRDIAYEALLKSRRKELHRQVAHTIEEKFAGLKETHPELLARHWTEADETERAIDEWERAGKAAERRSAFTEALASYEEALKVLKVMPDSAERDIRELALRQSALVVLLLVKGSVPEANEAARSAVVLARKSANFSQLLHLMTTRAFAVLIAGDIAAAAMLADETLTLADAEGDAESAALAHGLQVLTCWFRGDLAGAEKHFAAGLQFFERPELDGLSRMIADVALGVAGAIAYQLGRLALGRERQAKMRQIATNKESRWDIGSVGFIAASFHNQVKEYEQAAQLAEHALEVTDQFPELSSHLQIQLGHATAQLGRAGEGIALIRRGIAGLLKLAPHPGLAYFFTFLAQAHQRAGDIDEALESIEQSLRVNPEVRLAQPEAFRIRGELRYAKGQAGPAEADLRESIALAQNMGAKAFELRSAISLTRLLAAEGRRDEARTMLAEIYRWFTEGFDTPDLKEAKALLDELSA